MIIEKELDKKYASKNDLIEKLDSCEDCPFDDVLRGKYKTAAILYEKIPKGIHPHREMIEQICGKDMDDVCDIKYAVMRTHFDNYKLAQIGAVKIFRLDLGKREDRPEDNFVTSQEAWLKWAEMNSDISEGSYAIRHRKIWDHSIDMAGKHTLTEEGIYRIVMSDQETYDAQIRVFELLDGEERNRDKNGTNHSEEIADNN